MRRPIARSRLDPSHFEVALAAGSILVLLLGDTAIIGVHLTTDMIQLFPLPVGQRCSVVERQSLASVLSPF